MRPRGHEMIDQAAKLIQGWIEALDAGEKTADEVIAEMRQVGAVPDSGSDDAAAALAADLSEGSE
jgi:hypothetical protein